MATNVGTMVSITSAGPTPSVVRRGMVDRSSHLLAILLLVLLSGLPQIGIRLTSSDFGGERLTSLPLTRSLLLDKLLPEVSSLTPPDVSDFPPALTAPPPSPFPSFDGYARSADEPKPNLWLLNLTVSLYRHHSSYV